MAGIFLDANIVIDVIQKRRQSAAYSLFEGFKPYISPLSFHIYAYANKLFMPQTVLSKHLRNYILVPLNQEILTEALKGPTGDLEGNIQLHSAAAAQCVYFYTRDKKLIWLKHFSDFDILSPYPEDLKSI
jgi:hypothetical protein